MKRCLGLFLLVCCGMLHLGSALRCYNCSDYTGRCQNVQECTYEEDSCLSLTERDGKIIRQCFRFTDCDRSVLSQIFTDIYSHSSCCSGDLCNSDDYNDFRDVSDTAPPVLALILTVAGSLLSVWWFGPLFVVVLCP